MAEVQPVAPNKVFQYKDNAAKAISKIFTPDTADFRFEFDDGNGDFKNVPAHKILLSAESPVFKAMYSGNWSETTSVLIVDTSHEAFRDFLEYFYKFEVCLNGRNVDEILNLARKYEIIGVEQSCFSYLMEYASVTNVIQSLEIANLYSLGALQSKCKEIINANIKTILESETFCTCDSKMLTILLQSASLSCSAEAIFDACIQWSRRKFEQQNEVESSAHTLRAILGDCFQIIPFGRMPLQIFTDRLKTCEDLFTKGDIINIVSLIGESQSSSSDVSKSAYWQQIHYSFPSVGNREFYTPSNIGFRLNQTVILKAFKYTRLNGILSSTPYETILNVYVIKNQGPREICKIKHIKEADTENTIHIEMVGKRIIIEPNNEYQISVSYVGTSKVYTIFLFEAKPPKNDSLRMEIFDKEGQSVHNVAMQIADLYFVQC